MNQSHVSLTTISTINNNTKNQQQKQPWQPTPCSIKQTYCWDPVLSNDEDEPYNPKENEYDERKSYRDRQTCRLSCLQYVRDAERIKDHWKDRARNNKKTESTTKLHAWMPAAMMHAGGGVPFMMMAKFASPNANTKNMNRKNESKPPPSQLYPQ